MNRVDLHGNETQAMARMDELNSLMSIIAGGLRMLSNAGRCGTPEGVRSHLTVQGTGCRLPVSEQAMLCLGLIGSVNKTLVASWRLGVGRD